MVKINTGQKELIGTEALAIATINDDGKPNVIPVGFAKVVNNDTLIITDNFMRQTRENIIRKPDICLAVWSKDWKEGYKFIGKAEYQTSGKWMDFVKQMKENKDYPAKGAIVIKVEKIINLG